MNFVKREAIEEKRQGIYKQLSEEFNDSFSISDNAPLTGDAALRIHERADGRRLNTKDLYRLAFFLTEFNKLSQLDNLLEEYFPQPEEAKK